MQSFSRVRPRSTTLSTVCRVKQAVRHRCAGAAVACIGPLTAEAARRHALPVQVVAKTRTVEGLVDGLKAYFARRTGSKTGDAAPPLGPWRAGPLRKGQTAMNLLQPMPPTVYTQPDAPDSVRRPRRTRISPALRRMVRETTLSSADFIYPLFVRHGRGERRPIASMPGQFQLSVDQLAAEAELVLELGIPAVILFGIPAEKDWCGSDNFSPHGVVPEAIRALKAAAPELTVISDMCFCEYTDHGHCGLINTHGADDYSAGLPEGYLLNDPSLELLGRASVVHAEAGADVIAPSAMLDHMVAAVRRALDEASLQHVAILSYAAKYASSFYGPFRDAAESPPSFGDRSQYQMDPANRREALKEVALDVDEGADMIMGQAGPALSGRARRRAAAVQPAHRCLPCQRRVRHAPRGSGQWLARSAQVRARKPDQHQTRRRRHDPDLFRQGRGPLAGRWSIAGGK